MSTINIAITGAAGNMAYALLPRLGELLLDLQASISLRLLEVTPALGALEAVKMELEDCAYPFLDEIICTSNTDEAFKGADWIILIGAKPRGKGMERADLLRENAQIFKHQGESINQHASRDVKVLVVGNPCNTNAYITKHFAPDLPATAFYSLSMLDQHRAYTQLATKMSIGCDRIENLCVWGNHSATGMYVDYANALVDEAPLLSHYNDNQWLETQLQELVSQRGAAVINARGSSSAASAANAVIDTIVTLIDKDPDQGRFSLGVVSSGEYGAIPGLIVSYPCQFEADGELKIVEGLEHSKSGKAKLEAAFAELAAEVDQVRAMGLLSAD